MESVGWIFLGGAPARSAREIYKSCRFLRFAVARLCCCSFSFLLLASHREILEIFVFYFCLPRRVGANLGNLWESPSPPCREGVGGGGCLASLAPPLTLGEVAARRADGGVCHVTAILKVSLVSKDRSIRPPEVNCEASQKAFLFAL